MRLKLAIGTLVALASFAITVVAAADTSRGDAMLTAYFSAETQKLADSCRQKLSSYKDWKKHREEYRQELREMLGLDPLPELTPLNAVVTGKLDHGDFTVENLYFESRPHLYVTGNLYLPKNGGKPAPTILYVCGHSRVEKDGVSYGAKAHYQHHGAWFAQNGYVCLVIDTLQLAEITGIHDGTRRREQWWWNARGYSPADVEAWNSVRAIDYLESRPEVDASRIGITGRSGGGAYSWTTSALDDRIKVIVPVAGITTLKNYVVDDCTKGHCDCMFFVNTYRWDYPMLAAFAAPRPLLIANTDRDDIFPLDGVYDLYRQVRGLYEGAKKGRDVALQTAAGPHGDGQVLQLHALQWFNQYLKEPTPIVESAAKPYFTPEQLKVFEKLPADEINTKIQETFVAAATAPDVPASQSEWRSQRDKWMAALRTKSFRGWPAESKVIPSPKPTLQAVNRGIAMSVYDFKSQDDVPLRLYFVCPLGVSSPNLEQIDVRVMTQADWKEFLAALGGDFKKELAGEELPEANPESYAKLRDYVRPKRGVAFVAPRGIGPTAWVTEPAKQVDVRRRFMLLGQTVDGMRVWDVRRAVQTLRSMEGFNDVPLHLVGNGEMAGIALYAALFEPDIAGVEVHRLPKSHREGPDFLNVLRYLDVPQTVAMVAERSQVSIGGADAKDWEYPLTVAKKLGWKDRITIGDKALSQK